LKYGIRKRRNGLKEVDYSFTEPSSFHSFLEIISPSLKVISYFFCPFSYHSVYNPSLAFFILFIFTTPTNQKIIQIIMGRVFSS